MHIPSLIAQYGLACVAFIIFLGEIGLPILIPGEIALFLAGSRLVHSPVSLLLAWMALAAVDLLAAGVLHGVARSGGSRLLCLVLRRVFKDGKQPDEVLSGWHNRLSTHDAFVIFVVRSVPGIRLSATVVSGLLRLRIGHVLLGAAPGSLLWVGVPLVLGYALRARLSTIPLPDARIIVASAACLAAIVLLGGARWWVRRQRGRDNGRLQGANHTAG